MTPEQMGLGLLWYAVLIVSLTFHEAAHGLAALRFGDRTARDAGLVTLDPLPHIRRSPVGMVIVPILAYWLGGWMIGWASAPYNSYWAGQNRRQAALMALAGPAANLSLLILAGVLIRIGMVLGLLAPPATVTWEQFTVAQSAGLAPVAIVISILFSLNLNLFVFNLIPVPPLDGSEVLSLVLSERSFEQYRHFLAQPGAGIVGLIVAWHLIDFLLPPAQGLALTLLYPGVGYQ